MPQLRNIVDQGSAKHIKPWPENRHRETGRDNAIVSTLTPFERAVAESCATAAHHLKTGSRAVPEMAGLMKLYELRTPNLGWADRERVCGISHFTMRMWRLGFRPSSEFQILPICILCGLSGPEFAVLWARMCLTRSMDYLRPFIVAAPIYKNAGTDQLFNECGYPKGFKEKLDTFRVDNLYDLRVDARMKKNRVPYARPAGYWKKLRDITESWLSEMGITSETSCMQMMIAPPDGWPTEDDRPTEKASTAKTKKPDAVKALEKQRKFEHLKPLD